MSDPQRSVAERIASEYYDSTDADRFYEEVWGGEDIHIGLYASETEAIAQASQRTVSALMDLMGALSPGATVVDFGSGYGGAARRLAKELGVRVEAINISAVENSRHRQLNQSAKLQDLIRVHDASFEDVPLAESCADVVWSQDAILHSGNRQQVLQEAARLLKPGGVFVLTDPMAADGIDPASLSAILERIHLPDMGSPDRYRVWASQAGLSRDVWQEKTDMLIRHYSRVLEELQRREQELQAKISPDYLQRMAAGLGHWIDGGQQGRLSWGLMRFRKPLE